MNQLAVLQQGILELQNKYATLLEKHQQLEEEHKRLEIEHEKLLRGTQEESDSGALADL